MKLTLSSVKIIQNWFIILILLFYLSINVNLYAESNIATIHIKSNDEIYALDGKWHFRSKDKIEYKENNIDLSGWSLIHPHFPWTTYDEFRNYKGVSWYRMNIIIENLNTDFALLVPLHYRGAQFYINGNLFHQTRSFSPEGETPSILGKPTFFNIPSSCLKAGKNVIAIRTGWQNDSGGFFESIKFGPHKILNQKWIKHILWYSSLAAICIFFAIFFLFFYWNRTSEKYYLFFSGFSFSLGLWILGIRGFILWIIDHQFAFIISTYLGAILVPFMMINFIHSFLQLSKTWITSLINSFFIFLALLLSIEFMSTGMILYFQRYLYNPFILGSAIAFTYAIVLSIRGHRLKRPYATRIVVGNSAFALSYLFSIFRFLDIINIEPIITEGFSIMAIVFATALSSHFAQVHNDLEKAHNELLVFDKMKDEFMATTSHELRTPLHGIMGISESLMKGDTGSLNKKQRHNLELIYTSTTHLSKLVNDILDFSRIRAGKVDLFLEQMSLDETIGSVVSLFRVMINEKNITISTEIDKLPLIIADKRRLKQVIINLLGNAIKFTKEGRIKITAKQEGHNIEVSVSDTGIGIEKEQLPRIWAPFEQAEKADTRSHSGYGLGLAISREFVKMHKGKIWVESEKGMGSTFTFKLPINAEAIGINIPGRDEGVLQELTEILPAKDMVYSDVIEVQGHSLTSSLKANILAVDDDTANLQVIINICSQEGYSIITARTGPEALKKIKDKEPDLILLDLMLPGMSGYEICEKIKASDDELFIPVIMLTARNQPEDILKGFYSGSNDYLTKPFNRQELLARIKTQLSIKKMFEIEKTLNRALNVYNQIVSSSKESMAFIDINMKLIAVNDAFLKTYNKKKEDVIGQSVNNFFKGIHNNYKINNLLKCCLKGKEIHEEEWYDYPGIGKKYMFLSIYPYVDKNNEIKGAVLNLKDITERVQLEKTVVDISQNERRQIGMELHDGLSHQLLDIAIKSKLMSERLADKSITDEADEATKIELLTNKAIEETRNLARGIFPIDSGNDIFLEIIEEIKENIEKKHKMSCIIEVDKSLKLNNIQMSTHLYYIIQEAVNNAIKHSGGKTIQISLLSQKNNVSLLIKDDGAGIPEILTDNKGMGLNIMRYRARMCGASLDIRNDDMYGGTEVKCTFKYNKSRSGANIQM